MRRGAALLALALVAAAPEAPDLREFRVGMPVAAMPTSGYRDFACAGEPKAVLAGWTEFRACPADAAGRHAVSFRYDAAENPLAALNDANGGTRVGGQPVLLTALIGSDERLDGLVIRTDPGARLYLRKKAFLFAEQVRARYGEEGWHCVSAPAAAGEEPVGELLIHERCEKQTSTRRFLLTRDLFRPATTDLAHFVGQTTLEILLPDEPP